MLQHPLRHLCGFSLLALIVSAPPPPDPGLAPHIDTRVAPSPPPAPRPELAPPDDPVGTWKLTCVPPDGKSRACLVTVTREGDALRCEYTAEGKTRTARSITFDRGVLRVCVDGQYASQSYGLEYRGKPAGETIHGNVRWTFGIASGTFPFEGERTAPRVAAVP